MKHSSFFKVITCILLLSLCLPMRAVLKERNLSRTLDVLCLELEHSYQQQKAFMLRYEIMSRTQHKQLIDYMKRSEQISLMLYSQKADFTFDVAYACQQATTLYQQVHRNNLPYTRVYSRVREEVARYDSLILALEALPPTLGRATSKSSLKDGDLQQLNDSVKDATVSSVYELSVEEQKDRERCLIYAKALRNNLVRFLHSISMDDHHYNEVAHKVEKLNDYAQQRYSDLQQSIYRNGSQNYFVTLASLADQIKLVKRDFEDKYLPLNNHKNLSEWRGPIVLGMSIFMLVYIAIAILMSYILLWKLPLLLGHLFPKLENKVRNRANRWVSEAEIKRKKPLLTIVIGIILFAIIIGVIRGFLYNNLFLMATTLMVTFAWLIGAILLSLLIRLTGKQIKDGVRLYLPFICMAFIVILMRIVFIPNSLVNLLFPPLALIFVIWQVSSSRKYRDRVPLSDSVYGSISLATMVIATVASWIGFTLLAVQILIWWTFQLAAVQTITSLYDLLRMYENHFIVKRLSPQAAQTDTNLLKRMRSGEFFISTWLFDFLRMCVLPVLAVLSVLQCIRMAADVFEMGSTVSTLFFYNFIDKQGILQISLFKLSLVVSLFFLFYYINYAIRSYFRHWYKKARKDTSNFNEALLRNVTAIIVWGIYFVFVLVLLQVPSKGISIVTAGLATGMGFAMKDLLENFFYGLSLMTGRVRVGDYIECDGIQGKVQSITYQSTQILTLDGSVMAFLNSALFSKNFKNLTRNHGYELTSFNVGVAYGTDISKVRQLITETLNALRTKTDDGRDVVNPSTSFTIRFDDFGASSVDLKVYAWVLVEEKYRFLGEAKECVYNVLNANHIEMPFPQQDIYIRQVNAPMSSPS